MVIPHGKAWRPSTSVSIIRPARRAAHFTALRVPRGAKSPARIVIVLPGAAREAYADVSAIPPYCRRGRFAFHGFGFVLTHYLRMALPNGEMVKNVSD